MRKIYVIALGLIVMAMAPFNYASGQVQKPSKVIKPAYFDVSKPLRDVTPVKPSLRDRSWKENLELNKTNTEKPVNTYTDYTGPDPVLQTTGSGMRANDPSILQNFDGVNNVSGVAPPDTEGDVGPDHYFQMVNLSLAIFDKDGNILYGPVDNITLWDGFDGPWSSTNDGDPHIMYDEYADRWIASQFAFPNGASNDPRYELIAVSATGDPLGEWYRYAYEFDRMPDYPKFGVWHDGYYFTINQFYPFDGAGICVTNRDAMLNGDPDAELVFWDLTDNYFALLPADVDGELLPPEDAPAYMMNFGNNSLRMWEVIPDWDNTLNSSLQFKGSIPVEPFNNQNIVIRQPGTSQLLSTLSDRLMYRLQYRNFGDYEVLLTNHTVNAGGGRAGIRWYELRKEGDEDWEVYQQGTYAPDDGESRWMASVAMNQNGDIAIGYSVSSTDTYPSIRVAGQTNGAPEGLGILDITETEIYTGQNSQTGINRWGDYSSMSVDPSDDNTFWFTTEYSGGGWSWRTRIASIGFAQEPVSDFTSNEVIIPIGEDVDFTDLTSGIPSSWEWSFDGGEPATSNEKNPEGILYNSEGSFDVELVASNLLGADTIFKEEYIITSEDILPAVAFEADNNFVCLGEEVQFEDMTRHAPIQWLWEFDPPAVTFVNGTDATSQNPVVIFDEAALYNITLTAWNLNGESSNTETEYITAGGYMPYAVETFEDNDLESTHWTVENPDDEVTWELYETGGNDPGTISAGIDFSNYFKIGERDRLISPPFNLTGMSSAALEFRHAYAKRHEDYTDSLIIYVSTDCGEDWERIFAIGEDGSGNFATQEPMDDFWPSSAEDWCGSGYGSSCVALDLTPWTGESGVRIAFETYSSFGNPLFIDNITISQFVGTEENEIVDAEVLVYPNPANGTFNIVLPDESAYTEMNIVNFLGQSVYSAALNENDRNLTISPDGEWTKGIYFIRLSGQNVTTTRKIILN